MDTNNFSVADLIADLGSEDDAVRRRAQLALADLGILAIEPLGEALLHDDPCVRRRAAAVLGGVGDVRAVEPLITALSALKNKGDDLTLVQIVDALGHFGDPRAVQALIKALQVDGISSQVQRRIIAALVNIGDRRAIQPVAELAHDDEVGKTARWALNQLGATPPPPPPSAQLAV